MAMDLTVGTKIYRPARVVAEGDGALRVELETPGMQHFDDGATMLRAVPDAGLAPDWRVAPWREAGGRVCVCDEPIGPDWTHFEVLFADVNFAAVSPVAGDPEELRRKHLEAFLKCRTAAPGGA
jgi:hypothetical protein